MSLPQVGEAIGGRIGAYVGGERGMHIGRFVGRHGGSGVDWALQEYRQNKRRRRFSDQIDSMQTPPRTPKRHTLRARVNVRNRSSGPVIGKRKRSYSKAKGTMTESGTTMRAAKVVNRRKKSVTFKKKKKVIVSRKFKAQVAKALAPHQATGKYTEIGFQAVTFPLTLGNQQQVARLGIDANSGQLGLNSQILFSPAMILNAASVMFNGKTATRNQQYTLNAQLEYDFGTNSFDPRTSKITLKNSYAQFTLRNNTKRTWIIQLYEAAPKKFMSNPGENDCLQQWSNCMLNESQVAAAGPATINLASATPNTLYSNPMKNKMLMQKWNLERHDIILDPGQVYDHYVQGPSDAVYDYAKFWRADQAGTANVFYDWVKGLTRQAFIVARLDLTNDVARQTARHGIDDADLSQGRLCVEYKNYYNILAPPHTGGTGTVAGAVSTNLNERVRDCYYHKNWFTDTDAADVRMSRETETDNL